MKKTVLHIAEAAGGVERYLVSLLKKMQPSNDIEHILLCSDSFDCKKFENLVTSIEVVDSLHNPISMSQDFKSILTVRKLIKKYKPDIIYCHSSKAGAVGRIAATGLKKRVLYNAHGWSFNMKGSSTRKIKIYEIVERVLAKRTDKIICISEYERTSALEHKICKSDKLVVINNGIDFDEVSAGTPKSRSELGIPESAFVVGTIGRLAPQKAPDMFVKVAIEVSSQIQNAFFVIVGDDLSDGTVRDEIEKQIKEAGLSERFIITGWVDNPTDYISVFDVATLFSRWEGFGLVLPEYMYMGKPIVATKADAIPYVVGDAGLLVEIDDYLAAAEAIEKLCANQDVYHMLKEKERHQVTLFNAQRTADEHRKLFGVGV